MSLSSRLFLSWDEAASTLGYDREGLRQMMLNGLGDKESDDWLPVGFDTRGRDFVAALRWPQGTYEIAQNSDCVDFSGEFKSLIFTDGTEFPFSGRTNDNEMNWEATHDHRSGFKECYLVSGRFIVHPTVVEYACNDLGDLRPQSLRLVPREWIDGGPWQGFEFRLLSRQLNTSLPPENLFTDTFFYAADVQRILANRQSGKLDSGPSHQVRDLRADAKRTYERIIAVLWKKAHGDGGPGRIAAEQHTAATSIANVLTEADLASPDVDTIARRLKESLAHGIKIGSSD